MLKKLSAIAVVALLVTSCAKEQEPEITSADLVSKEDIKTMVEADLAAGSVFHWTSANDEVIYSAAMHSDSVFSIGYTPDPNFDFENKIHTIDLASPQWSKAWTKVMDVVLSYESKARGKKLTADELMPLGDDKEFPHMMVQLTSLELVKELRSMDEVRFVEPLGFNFEDEAIKSRSGQGCNGSPDYGISTSDYSTESPNTKMPWNYPIHNIDDAWAYSQGDNIRLAILDTGASNSQDNLGSQFTQGQSGGRDIIKTSTLYSGSWWWRSLDSPHDDCGHGTSMAGIAAAPRGTDGNATGVAYKANLMSINSSQDVIISTSNERKGVRDAMKAAANRSDVKIISMSLGTPFYSSTVADGVFYAYNRNKLIFAAAGTSLSWTSWYPVIFPANMSQCRAVTGVRDGSNIQRCRTCHSGSEVDFVIVMERASDGDRTSISLASSSNQPKYTGGSSCATATTAGIAALVWAENPSASRSTIVDVLKQASHYYPNRNSQFGWGKIDAAAAVTGI